MKMNNKDKIIIEDGDIVACIVEGAAEQAVIDMLLEYDLLIFNQNNLLSGKPIRTRSAKKFESDYLGKSYNGKIIIFRILDNPNEKFKISKANRSKIKFYNIITFKEIEILVILNENKYKEYKMSKLLPSEFCKQKLNIKYSKEYIFWKEYFSDINGLLKSIYEYVKINKMNVGYSLKDIIHVKERLLNDDGYA